jgi:hypothetical protein
MDPEPSCALHASGSRVTVGGGDGVVHAEAQRHEGKEKDNFLLFFFAASRLCVIKMCDKIGCAGARSDHF